MHKAYLEKSELSNMFQLRPKKEKVSSCFRSHTVTKCPFCGLYGSVLGFFWQGLHFCDFCCLFHCLKYPMSIVLKYLVCLNARRLWCALWKKIYMLDVFHSDMGYRAVWCEISMNESTILNKRSLNTNTQKTRSCANQLWLEAYRNLPQNSPECNGLCLLIVCDDFAGRNYYE